MQVEPLVVGQPEADVLELVRRVVVQNDMHRQAFRDLLVDLGEELEELLVIESGTRSSGSSPTPHRLQLAAATGAVAVWASGASDSSATGHTDHRVMGRTGHWTSGSWSSVNVA